jgi:hypothetical protein
MILDDNIGRTDCQTNEALLTSLPARCQLRSTRFLLLLIDCSLAESLDSSFICSNNNQSKYSVLSLSLALSGAAMTRGKTEKCRLDGATAVLFTNRNFKSFKIFEKSSFSVSDRPW